MEPNWLGDEPSRSVKIRYRIRQFNSEVGEWLSVLMPWVIAGIFVTGIAVAVIHLINK
jgi:hypothetical protein